jgi:hypothetical protein
MFCPSCGQERFSEETSFCSRCGYLLSGTAELLRRGGVLPDMIEGATKQQSPRAKGVKQGLFLMLLAVVLVPIMGILLRFAIGMPNPWPIGVVLFLLGGGGLLRMVYALLFEQGAAGVLPSAPVYHAASLKVSPAAGQASLPPQRAQPASDYVEPRIGGWRDTNDLEPRSVTDGTTKLLEKEGE